MNIWFAACNPPEELRQDYGFPFPQGLIPTSLTHGKPSAAKNLLLPSLAVARDREKRNAS